METSRAILALVFLANLGATAFAKSAAPKPEKEKVAFGAFTGPGAGSFKSGIRSIVAKACVITSKKSARALIEGESTPKDKGVVFRLVIKGAQNGEVVESREFPSPKPSPSSGLVHKIGRAAVEMAQRVPVDQPAP
jgi:hypothetical protein